jgi:hypothetical protein
VSPPLEVAQHQGCPVLLRQPVQLLIEHRTQLQDFGDVGDRGSLWDGDLDFAVPAANRLGAGLPRGPESHAIKPCGDEIPVTDRLSRTKQHQERCLEGVFDVPWVAEHPPAHTQHHRTVPVDQSLEGGLIPARQIALQELPVTKTG